MLDTRSILRAQRERELCLTGPFDAKAANARVLALLARAADLRLPALQAHVVETQRQVRACFERILESA